MPRTPSFQDIIEQLRGLEGQDKLLQALRLHVLKDVFETPSSFKDRNSPNYRSWTQWPYRPDPSHEEEITLQYLANASMPKNSIVKMFESGPQGGFQVDTYVQQFRAITETPEAYFSEIALRKHFLLDLGNKRRHKDEYFLKDDPIFAIDIKYSRLLTRICRHGRVPRTRDLMVSLWDVPRYAHHGNAEYLSLPRFLAFVLVTNSKSRIRAQILTPDQSNDLLRQEKAERQLNDAEIQACRSEGTRPPPRLPNMPTIHKDQQNILLYAANGPNEQVMRIRKSDNYESQGIRLTLEDNLPPLLVHATETENLESIRDYGFTTAPSGNQRRSPRAEIHTCALTMDGHVDNLDGLLKKNGLVYFEPEHLLSKGYELEVIMGQVTYVMIKTNYLSQDDILACVYRRAFDKHWNPSVDPIVWPPKSLRSLLPEQVMNSIRPSRKQSTIEHNRLMNTFLKDAVQRRIAGWKSRQDPAEAEASDVVLALTSTENGLANYVDTAQESAIEEAIDHKIYR